ncbi:MAG TPA: hypothetical protein VG733_15220 [Chthoniobacteraceae bacterium]|nr:hypothetical protein [Chthoniobacteraceae bacterium]
MPLIGIAASIVLMTKIRGTTFLILGLVFFLLLLPAFVGISSEEYEQVSWWEYAIPSAYAAIWFALGLYDVIRSEKAAHAPK